MTTAFLSTGGIGVNLALILVIVFAVWETWRGFRRGAIRQAVHALLMVFSAFIAYWVTCGIVDTFMSELSNTNMADLLASPEIAGTIPAIVNEVLVAADVTLLSYLVSLPLTLIIAPVFFLCLFVIVALLMKIVCAVLLMLLRPFIGEKNMRYVGMAIGALEGVAMALVLLMPFAAVSGLVFDSAEAAYAEEAEIITEEENGVLRLARALGGDAMLKSFSTVEIDGKEFVIADEAIDVIAAALIGTDLAGAEFTSLTEDEKAVVDDVLEIVYGSDYLTNLFFGTLALGGDFTDDLASELEIDGDYRGLVTALGQVFSAGSVELFETDMEALKSAYYVLSDSGALAAIPEGSDALSEAMATKDENGDTVVTRVTRILNKNDRTRPIVTELTKLSLKLIVSGDEEVPEELYDNVKAGVTETLTIEKDAYSTPEEYKAAVTESLDTTLKENNIDLEPEVVADMADYIDENYDDLKDATDEQINEIILSYHDAYMEYLNNREPTTPEE